MTEKPRRLHPAKKKPSEVDCHIGVRLRLARKSSRLSQKELAAKIGVSHQQVQKHEAGENRVGAGMLYLYANALSIPIDFFYCEMSKHLNGGRFSKDFIVLSELSNVKASCIKLISEADDAVVSPVHTLLERIKKEIP